MEVSMEAPRIRVPKPAPGSFNKNRPVSTLLQAQAEHMAEAVKKHIQDEMKAIKTEGEASEYIKKMGEFLRQLRAKS
jgi:hypothetical protein